MNKRSTKFYRKNEEEVMKAIGLKPTKNSGAGWIEKEDGQNEYLICQLKSTDARSISVKQDDLHTLEYNACVSHKIPVFAIQFLNSNEVWVMAKPQDIAEVAKYIETGKCEVSDSILAVGEAIHKKAASKIKSSEKARQLFNDEQSKKYKKEKKAW